MITSQHELRLTDYGRAAIAVDPAPEKTVAAAEDISLESITGPCQNAAISVAPELLGQGGCDAVLIG